MHSMLKEKKKYCCGGPNHARTYIIILSPNIKIMSRLLSSRCRLPEISRIDADVEWGKTYKYEIIAVYNKQQSETPAIASITLGDEECEERYSELTGWDLFCSVEESLRKSILSCSNENKLVTAEDCSDYDGVVGEKVEVWFCAEIGEHNAVCKDAGECNIFFQAADPFGLHYTRNKCYNPETSEAPEDAGTASYCYYDYTGSIVNQCKQCDTVTGCFDYNSKDACNVNNCLGIECQWIDSAAVNPLLNYSALFSGLNIPATVTPETGAGYCTEVDYSDDDKCSLCVGRAACLKIITVPIKYVPV